MRHTGFKRLSRLTPTSNHPNLRAHFELEVPPIRGRSASCSIFRCWDNKGWFFYSREGKQYFPKLKAAIAAWRLSR